MTIRKTKSQNCGCSKTKMIKITDSKAESYLFYGNIRSTVLNRSKYGKTYLLPFKYSNSRYTKRKKSTRFQFVYTVGVKQLTDFLHTVTAASDLVDCTLVNCVFIVMAYSSVQNTPFYN